MPLVSIIILNYNGLSDLKACLDSLYNLAYHNIEIIFVDNNSQDKSVEYVKRNYKEIKVVELKKNYGFAKGNNLGVAYANGEYIVLLNTDTEVDVKWLSELVKFASEYNEVGIVGSKIYYYDDRNIINFAGSSSNILGQGSQIGAKRTDSNLLNKTRKSFYACGASILFKRHVYQKIGLFDPSYFAYYEDVDFCWRAWVFGYDVFFVPTSFLYHKIGRVIKSTNKKKYLGERNRLRSLLINYERKSLLKILPSYFWQWVIKVNKKLHSDKNSAYDWILIYLKVIIWNIMKFRSLIIRRRFVQLNRIRDDKFIFRLMNELQEIEKSILKK